MLKRIFADNYRALVNFELRPGPRMSLLLGGNGSGKTTVFDVLGSLRDLIVLGRPVSELFANSLTRWETRNVQRFELEVGAEGSTYRYALEVEHPKDAQGNPFIRSELVTLDGETIYRFSAGEVSLSSDDRSVAAAFPFRPDRSFLPNVSDQSVAKQLARLAGFTGFMAKFWRVQPNPFALDAFARQDDLFLTRNGSNFASFFSYLNSERPDVRTELENRLREALPGFSNLRFQRVGDDAKALFARFKTEGSPAAEYTFLELSEGQRVLAILYAVACGLVAPGAMLYLDEPDNFVSLSEIQPWLQVLRDALDVHRCQAMIISHHPEVIDYLSLDSLCWFERPAGPVIVRPIEPDAASPLKLSEALARGAA